MKHNITDNDIIAKCKDILNAFSAAQAYSPTKQLGSDSEFVSAESYSVNRFTLKAGMRTRRFHLEQLKNGSEYYRNPKDIDDYDMWDDIKEDDKCSEFDVGIDETTHARTCPQCNGEKEIVCSSCDGKGYKKCTKKHVQDFRGKLMKECWHCHGTGKANGVTAPSTPKCSSCNGHGYVECECHGTMRVECSRCDGKGVVVCPSCEGTGHLIYEWFLQQKYRETAKVVCFKPHDNLTDKFINADGLPWENLHDETRADEIIKDEILRSIEDSVRQEMERVNLVKTWEEKQKEIENEAETFRKENADSKFRYSFEKVCFEQYDGIVKYEYCYDGKNYTAWINLSTGAVEEVDNGLYAQIAADTVKLAEDAEKNGNPQEAIYYYCKADAISLKWGKENGTQRKRVRQYRLLGWMFAGPVIALAMLFWLPPVIMCGMNAVGIVSVLAILVLIAACMISLNEAMQLIGFILILGFGYAAKMWFGAAISDDLIFREGMILSLVLYAIGIVALATDPVQRLPFGRKGLLLGGAIAGVIISPIPLYVSVYTQSFVSVGGFFITAVLLLVLLAVRLPVRLKAGKMQRFVEKNLGKGEKIRKVIESRKPSGLGIRVFSIFLTIILTSLVIGLCASNQIDSLIGNLHYSIITALQSWNVL